MRFIRDVRKASLGAFKLKLVDEFWTVFLDTEVVFMLHRELEPNRQGAWGRFKYWKLNL